MPKSTGYKISPAEGGTWLVEAATSSESFPTRTAARAYVKAQFAAAAEAQPAIADDPPRPTEDVVSDALNETSASDPLLGVPAPAPTPGPTASDTPSAAQPSTGPEEAPDAMTKNTITVGLSGKVHTLLTTGQSAIGRPDPKSPPVSIGDAIPAKLARNKGLHSAIVDAERSERSKGYVTKVTLDERQANRLVSILEEMVEALTGVKGGGYDAANCRRYAAAAADRIREAGNGSHGWRFTDTDSEAA